jgi:hypothetical protein
VGSHFEAEEQGVLEESLAAIQARGHQILGRILADSQQHLASMH